MNRKNFIRLSSMGLGSFALSSFENNPQQYPIVISTWDSGKAVNEAAWKILAANGHALDAVENGARQIEDTISCCVGLGGFPDRDGIVTLDASIMDENANCGSVAGLERIKHPVSVARKVMEKTPHVMLVGNGAQQFALENGFDKESGNLSDDAKKAYDQWLKKNEYKPSINIELKNQNGPFAPAFFEDGSPNHDTMALIALDAAGKLSGAVTTSGMAFKVHGRVGDSPIIGAGLYVDNQVGAAVSTGVGEEAIRICGSHLVVEFMRQGSTPEIACKKAVQRIVKKNPEKAKSIQVAFLALNSKGQYGAFAIQKGFVFCVKSKLEDKMIRAKSIF